jgi:ATP-dependent RNA helicase RhlE
LLVATDIASRGIDVEDVTHVFNYDLPNEPESYVHRIGRTARAGKSGVAYGFCDDSESGYLVGIQRLIGKSIPVIDDHPYHFAKAIPKPNQKPGKIKVSKKNHHNSKPNQNKNEDKYRPRRRKKNNKRRE